eukprot:s1554_g10.t1
MPRVRFASLRHLPRPASRLGRFSASVLWLRRPLWPWPVLPGLHRATGNVRPHEEWEAPWSLGEGGAPRCSAEKGEGRVCLLSTKLGA